MASAVQSMRICLRAASRRAAATSAAVAPRPCPRPRPCLAVRPFSSTPLQRQAAAKKDDIDRIEDEVEDIADDYEPISVEELQEAAEKMRNDSEYGDARLLQDQMINSINNSVVDAIRVPKKRLPEFWFEDEADPDLLLDEADSETFDEDDIMSMAHGKLEEYREFREYARIAAWQMPLLSKLATPFVAPGSQQPLRFRYTSYMGEFHPAEKKVVVEFSPRDLPLNEAQQQKLRKLLGPRWNPETDIAKMSCEQFEHPAQNKRYLGDVVNKLVENAKDPTDMFEDVAIDTRHHTFKIKPKFPKEWRMTEERRQFLEDTRQKSLLLDQAKEDNGTLIDGTRRIDTFFNAPTPKAEPVSARLSPPVRPLRYQSQRLSPKSLGR
ncbi:mitochondrial ribosomal subunit protein-domain-containing protein [Astrocystis sublimbata]|nr:mitochondrial ribosomal subunit protein-domain-containing protein [Astrocystis sublimbata]